MRVGYDFIQNNDPFFLSIFGTNVYRLYLDKAG